VEEIAREAEEEIAQAARLAKEANRRNRHSDWHDDFGSSNHEPRDGALSRRHHSKFNS
jgi:hypothetical protein